MLGSNVFGDSDGPFRSDHPSMEKGERSQRGQSGVPPYCRKELRAPPAASLSHRLHDDQANCTRKGRGFRGLLVHEKSALTWKRGMRANTDMAGSCLN